MFTFYILYLDFNKNSFRNKKSNFYFTGFIHLSGTKSAQNTDKIRSAVETEVHLCPGFITTTIIKFILTKEQNFKMSDYPWTIWARCPASCVHFSMITVVYLRTRDSVMCVNSQKRCKCQVSPKPPHSVRSHFLALLAPLWWKKVFVIKKAALDHHINNQLIY